MSSLWDEFSYLGESKEGDYACGNSLFLWCKDHGERGKLLEEEWDLEKNRNLHGELLDRGGIAVGSHKKYWWKCKECGNEFKMAPATRALNGQGCPICGHKRGGQVNRANAAGRNNFESWCMENGEFGSALLEEWDSEKNMEEYGIKPSEISIGGGQKINWVCKACGTRFQNRVQDRMSMKIGCPRCRRSGTSYPEKVLYFALLQVYDDTINRGKLFDKVEYDIFIPSINVALEYNGYFWHEGRGEKDEKKRELCEEHGIRLFQVCTYKGDRKILFDGDNVKYAVSEHNHDRQLREITAYILERLGHDIREIDFEIATRDACSAMHGKLDNNFLKVEPCLAKEWNVELNKGIDPECYSAGSHMRIHWKCTKCKRDWVNSIGSRIKFQSGCPKCGYNIFTNKYGGANKHRRNDYVEPGRYTL